MPWGDGTGPWGLGPMTGRAAGYCAGYPVPGYMNPMPRFGLGFRRRLWAYSWYGYPMPYVTYGPGYGYSYPYGLPSYGYPYAAYPYRYPAPYLGYW